MKRLIFYLVLGVLSFIIAISHLTGSDLDCLFDDEKREQLQKSPNRKKYHKKAAILCSIQGVESWVYAACDYWYPDNNVLLVTFLVIFLLTYLAPGRLWKKYISDK